MTLSVIQTPNSVRTSSFDVNIEGYNISTPEVDISLPIPALSLRNPYSFIYIEGQFVRNPLRVYPKGFKQSDLSTIANVPTTATDDTPVFLGDTSTTGTYVPSADLSDSQKLSISTDATELAFTRGSTLYQFQYEFKVLYQDNPLRAISSLGVSQTEDELVYSEGTSGGNRYVIPIGIISQYNAGSYHRVYNPNGARQFADDMDWRSTSLKIISPEQCVDSTITASTSLSGRTDSGVWNRVGLNNILEDYHSQVTSGTPVVPSANPTFPSNTSYEVPMIGPGPSKSLIPSGIRRLVQGTGDLEFDATGIFPQESIQIGYSGVLSALGALPLFRSYITGRRGTFPFTYWDRSAGSARSVEISASPNEFAIAQGISTDVIVPGEYNFQIPTTSAEIISRLHFLMSPGEGVEGLRLRLTVVGIDEPFYYWPSRSLWESGVGRDNEDTGSIPNETILDFENAPLFLLGIADPQDSITINIEFGFTGGALLGVGTVPYFGVDRNQVTLSPLANVFEGVTGLTSSLSGQDLTITASRPENKLATSTTITLPTTADNNDHVDAVTTAISGQDLTVTLGRTGSLADLVSTVSLPDVDNYVDAINTSLSGQDLTITVGRTGALGDLSTTITIPSTGVVPVTDPTPSFSRFEFQSQATSVAPGTVISGQKSFVIGIEHPELLTGTITITQDSTVISSGTIVPLSQQTVLVTINTYTLANASDTEIFMINASVASGGNISRQLVTRAFRPHDLAFYGIRPTNDFDTVDTGLISSVDITTNTQFLVSGAFPNTNYIGILVPSSHDVTKITTFGLPAIDQFTRNGTSRMINSVQYISYTLQNLGGVDGTAAYTVEV